MAPKAKAKTIPTINSNTNIVSPTRVNITLKTKEEKARWANLAPLDTMPSRYPHEQIMTSMGIKDSVMVLLEAGHLTQLFTNRYWSYKIRTVEFLSTLHVEYDDDVIASITFRLANKEYSLSLAEFNAIFGLLGDNEEGYITEPEDYDRDDFWRRITLGEESTSSSTPRTFNPSRAKISSIRNPVLRYMAKALVCYPFAHKELGSISSEMLFILWGMLAHRRINTGCFMIRHLERHSKKKNGKVCCGGVVAALALHFGVAHEGIDRDDGGVSIDWDLLKKAGMITLTKDGVGYFVLDSDRKQHFKFPDPQLTAVGGWTYRANWLMNTPDHEAKTVGDLPGERARPRQNPMHVAPHYIQQPNIPNEPMPTEMEEDAEEDTEAEEGPSSQPKRSRPRGRPTRDSYLAEIAAGVRNLQLAQSQQDGHWTQVQQWHTDDTAWRAQQDSHWTQVQQWHADDTVWREQQDSHWAQAQQWHTDDIAWRAQQDSHWTQAQQWHNDDTAWRAQQESRVEQLHTRLDASDIEAQAFYRAYYARFPPPSD